MSYIFYGFKFVEGFNVVHIVQYMVIGVPLFVCG